jgi:hypothetical protein
MPFVVLGVEADCRRAHDNIVIAHPEKRSNVNSLANRLRTLQAAELRRAVGVLSMSGSRPSVMSGRGNTQSIPSSWPSLSTSSAAQTEVDEEVSRVNGSAPPNEHRRLLGVELTARGLESFSTADPPIAKAVQLPDWAHRARMVLPPPRAFDPASFAPVPFDRRLSADWYRLQEEGRSVRE